MITRDDIPIGASYDSSGRMQTLKTSTGFWLEYTYDAKGRVLTYKNSDGYRHEYTYDSDGRALTCKDSTGYWREFTYDAKGRELTYKKEGFSGTRIADDGNYVLYHDADRDLFKAGCQGLFTRDEALRHWDRDDERAIIFTKAIREAV